MAETLAKYRNDELDTSYRRGLTGYGVPEPQMITSRNQFGYRPPAIAQMAQIAPTDIPAPARQNVQPRLAATESTPTQTGLRFGGTVDTEAYRRFGLNQILRPETANMQRNLLYDPETGQYTVRETIQGSRFSPEAQAAYQLEQGTVPLQQAGAVLAGAQAESEPLTTQSLIDLQRAQAGLAEAQTTAEEAGQFVPVPYEVASGAGGLTPLRRTALANPVTGQVFTPEIPSAGLQQAAAPTRSQQNVAAEFGRLTANIPAERRAAIARYIQGNPQESQESILQRIRNGEL